MSAYTKRGGVTNHPEETMLQEFTDLIRVGGVMKLATAAKASEKAAGADMSVDLAVGSVYLKRGGGSCYPVRIASIENVSGFSANTSGNPRTDAVVVYNDLVMTPNSTGEGADVPKFLIVEGTPAASPQAPSDSDIEAELGASDPYERVCNVTIPDQTTAITDAMITDTRRVVRMAIPRKLETVQSNNFTPTLNDSAEWIVEISGNVTINEPTDNEIGEWFTIKIVQDATGGRTVTWNFTDLDWLSPDYSIADGANEVTTYAFREYEAGKFEGYLVGKTY